MKTATAVLGIAILTAPAFGEGFLNLPGETSTIQIATNEAIVITSVYDAHLDTMWPQYILAGKTNQLAWKPGAIFVGPADLITTNRCFASYTRFPAPYLHTLVWTNGWTNNIKHHISVPSGRTFRLLGALDNNPVEIYAARPGSTNFVNLLSNVFNPPFDSSQSVELIGPIELELSTPSCCAFRIYYFVDDAAEATSEGYLCGPAGTYQVAVEKSLDMKSWSPLMLKSTETSEARAFYRLRITK